MDTSNDISGGTKRRLDDSSGDIEETCNKKQRTRGQATLPLVTRHTTSPSPSQVSQNMRSWKDILGPPPSCGHTRVRIIVTLLNCTYMYMHVHVLTCTCHVLIFQCLC